MFWLAKNRTNFKLENFSVKSIRGSLSFDQTEILRKNSVLLRNAKIYVVSSCALCGQCGKVMHELVSGGSDARQRRLFASNAGCAREAQENS